MRPPPTTAEILEEAALRAPTLPALREEGSELDYAQLHGMLVQCALQLQRLGVRRGDRVAVSGPGFGIQLVLLLAAEGLGAATASFQAEDDADAAFLFTQVDWVFSARPQQVPPGVRFHQVDQAFARALAQPPAGERPAWDAPALHEPQRISRTSGSSGQSKFMVLSRAAQEQWIATGTEKLTYGPGTRLLVAGPFVTNGALARSSACLRRGGMLLAPLAGAALPREQPTHIWGLPLHLQQLLAGVPAGYVSPQPVQVATVGGAMSPQLRAQAARVFHGWIKNRYGSNEAGGICEEIGADGVGLLCAGVEVRIVDAEGRDLPAGQAGRIAVRTPCLVDGYLQRPQESAAAFRDGWFFSGDVGALVGRRRLLLLGRHDDLVNVGGIKLPAATLEARIREQPAIADCAVLAVHLEGGGVTLGIAAVPVPLSPDDAVLAQLQQALRSWPQAGARVLLLSALPRLAGGKTDRMALLRQFQSGT